MDTSYQPEGEGINPSDDDKHLSEDKHLSPGARRARERARKWRESPGVAVIPGPLLLRRDIPQSAKLLFAVTTTSLMNNEAGACRASDTFLAALFDVHIDTVQRWIRALTRAGFLRVEHDGRERLLLPQLTTHGKNTYPEYVKIRSVDTQKYVSSIRKNTAQTQSIDKERLRDPLTLKNIASHDIPTPKMPTCEEQVETAVELANSPQSGKRFAQLYRLAVKAGRLDVWSSTLDDLRDGLREPGRIESPGAWLNAELTRRLTDVGVVVPTGHRQDRARVREIIRQSMPRDET